MDNSWPPDPPGTINPAKLHTGATAFDPDPATADAPTAPVATESGFPTTSAPTAPRSAAPRLPRISSGWDPEHDIVARGLHGYMWHQGIRNEFEDLDIARPRAAGRARQTSHHGHFRRQTQDKARVHVPVDPRADPDAAVVIDRATASIYDAYLLKADVAKKTNVFRRHQVRQHVHTHTAT